VAGSFFFFFLVGLPEANMATEGGRISPPGRWGGSRPPPMAKSIFFFFVVRRKSRRRWRRPSPEMGGRLR
jgi:hypothetical protein